MEYFFKVFRDFADFKGRSHRKEFWMFGLINFLLMVALFMVCTAIATMSDDFGIFLGVAVLLIYFLIIFVPCLAVTVRRFHDTGKSGWFTLLHFIPTVGVLIILIFMCIDSDPGDNRYGPNPKGIGNKNEIGDIGLD